MAAHKEEEPDPLAGMPPVPAKTTFEAKDPEPYDAAKRLPPVDEDKVEAIGNPGDKERLQSNLKAAGAARQPPLPRRCAGSHAPPTPPASIPGPRSLGHPAGVLHMAHEHGDAPER